jgi:hypothetical protein
MTRSIEASAATLLMFCLGESYNGRDTRDIDRTTEGLGGRP